MPTILSASNAAHITRLQRRVGGANSTSTTKRGWIFLELTLKTGVFG
jgi:hypothetical protein